MKELLLCKCYYCTIKLDTYRGKEFSWGKTNKYSGQNSHSMYKIKHLIADWRTQAMISNRISALNKDFLTLLSKIQAEKYRYKQGTCIAIVKIRKEHRTIQDKQYNDGKQRERDIYLIYQRCPWEDWDQTQWFLTQQCLCPTFCPCSCAGTCLHCRAGFLCACMSA